MIGYIKNQIFNAIRGTDKKWWEVVDGVAKGLQRETRKPQHADDAERRGEEIEPNASEDATGKHQKERQSATSDRQGGQGQGHHQAEVREGIHARLERRGLHRSKRIERTQRSPSHSYIVPTYN